MEKPTTTSKHKEEGGLVAWVKSLLLPLVIVASVLGTVTDAFEELLKASDLLALYPRAFGTALWIAVLLIVTRLPATSLGPLRLHQRQARIVAVVVVTIGYLLIVWYPIRCLYLDCGPASPPPVRLPSDLTPLVGRAFAQSATLPSLRIVRFGIDKKRSSYLESVQDLSFEGGAKRTFEYDRRVSSAFERAQCTGIQGEQPILNVLPVLKMHLEEQERHDLLPFVDSYHSYQQLVQRGGNFLVQIVPTSKQIESLAQESPRDYDALAKWFVSCVGVTEPVIDWIVRNEADRTVSLIEMRYEVLAVGSVRGGETKLLKPIVTYDHVLEHAVGIQRFPLDPAIQISAEDTVRFAVRIQSGDQGIGLTWLLKVHLVDDRGGTVATPEFQLLLSK